jgi:phage gpG-like protein
MAQAFGGWRGSGMTNITIEIEGLEQVQAEMRRIGKEAADGVAKAVTATALEINTGVKKLIQRGPKTGRTYTRRGIEHTASAPGEAPATDTGTLASSVYFEQSDKLTATIGSRLAYAYYLEFGTTRIAARPAWVPETELGQKKLQERVTASLKRATK